MTTVEPAHAPAMPVTPLPLLPYADLPARWGVSVERSPKSVRVVVPPVPTWRHLHKGYFIAFAVLCTTNLAEVVVEWDKAGVRPLILAGIGLLVALGIGVALAVRQLRRRTVVEISDKLVSVRFLPSRRPTQYMSWARERISEIRLNPFDDMLLIRVTGVDLVEVYLSPNHEVNRAVAAVLADALKATEPQGQAVAAGL